MQKTSKKEIIKKVVIVFIVLALLSGIATGAFFGAIWVSPAKFQKEIEDSEVFVNDFSNKIPQTALYDVMYDHFFLNTSGKTPKLLFVGYDGCVANAIPLQKDYEKSAVFRVNETGGIYLGYCGGETPGDQQTSTGPGWATVFTGVWATEHGVFENPDILSESYRTILYKLASEGIPTSYTVTWDKHIEVTYSKEVASVALNGYPLDYILARNDNWTFFDMKNRIVSGRSDAIFGILEYPDSTGHTWGFDASKKKYKKAVNNSEDDAYELINAIEARSNYKNEDWLIVIMSDHGGSYRHHGKTTIMESTIFFASNKPIFD